MTQKKKTSSKIKTKPSKRQKRAQKTPRKTLFKRVVFFLFLLIGIISAYIFYCAATLPDLDAAFAKTRQPSTVILAENGHEIQTFGNAFAFVIYPKDLPAYIPDAVVNTEDRRFYRHFGLDIIGLTRAAVVNIFKRRCAQGASTITQQVAKNLFLTSQKNLKRKIQELLIAFRLEKKFTKEQILTLYLNRVYLGAGTYGFEAAANKYFNKSAADLSLKETAVLVGMLKAPSKYNPLYSKKNAEARANIVLDLMFQRALIGKSAYEAAKAEPLVLSTNKVEGGKHFADMVYAQINDYIGTHSQDIYVKTTLDQNLQQHAEKILQQTVADNLKNNVHEGALVILDYQGAVKALVGGTNYQKNQFNRATQALRQTGSVFKTFVYITALQHGFHKNSIISDTKVHIGSWAPENNNKKYAGDVTLDYAFAHSLNAATVNLSKELNLSDIIKNASKMGITTPLKQTPSLVLGSAEVKLIDMATAYLTIANGGYAAWPYFIEEIAQKQGTPLYIRSHTQNVQILDEKIIEEITAMLENVISNGTGKNAELPFFAAGKTGTTQNFRDAWFVGFTKKYVVAVWLGNDDNSPMKNITGGSLPAQIFRKIMLQSMS